MNLFPFLKDKQIFWTQGEFLFITMILFGVTALFTAVPLPNINEHLYLLLPLKFYNDALFLNDWMLSSIDPAHYVFNLITGVFMKYMPLEVVGWLGRIVSWLMGIIVLLRLGLKYEIPLKMAGISIFLWLVYGQSFLADTSMLKGFEAKTLAYSLLFLSLSAFINKRNIPAAALLGATFSLHPAIGLFSILSLGLSFLFLRYPLKTLLKIMACTALFAAPGIIPLLPSVFGDTALTYQDKAFLTLWKMPHHLDPFSWDKRTILLQFLFLFFNWLHYRYNKKNPTFRLLIRFQLFLGLFFIMGLGCRFVGAYQYIVYFPFQIFAVTIPLFFFLHLMHAYHHKDIRSYGKPIQIVGFIAILSCGNFAGAIVDNVKSPFQRWTRGHSNLQDTQITRAFEWISQNTPQGSIAILPPWRHDGWYVTQRARVASYRYHPYDNRLSQWRQRVESLVGKIDRYPIDFEAFERHFNNLSQADIDVVAAKYGATYLVNRGPYSYPVLFDSGTYKVYDLRRSP